MGEGKNQIVSNKDHRVCVVVLRRDEALRVLLCVFDGAGARFDWKHERAVLQFSRLGVF